MFPRAILSFISYSIVLSILTMAPRYLNDLRVSSPTENAVTSDIFLLDLMVFLLVLGEWNKFIMKFVLVCSVGTYTVEH